MKRTAICCVALLASAGCGAIVIALRPAFVTSDVATATPAPRSKLDWTTARCVGIG